MKPIIAANWKMNKTVGESVLFAERLSNEFAKIEDKDIPVINEESDVPL